MRHPVHPTVAGSATDEYEITLLQIHIGDIAMFGYQPLAGSYNPDCFS